MQTESLYSYLARIRDAGEPFYPSADYYKRLVLALMDGDKSVFDDMKLPADRRTTRLSLSDIRHRQNMVVVICTLASYCAILNNISSETALSASDYFMQAAEKLDDPYELGELGAQVGEYFCNLICKYKDMPYSRTVKRIVTYIYDEIYSPVFVENIAQSLQMNASYLSKMFKAEMGMSINTFIHVQKLNEARSLMRYSGASLTDIAAMLGYTDLSHFSRVCKKVTGLSPGALRASLPEKEERANSIYCLMAIFRKDCKGYYLSSKYYKTMIFAILDGDRAGIDSIFSAGSSESGRMSESEVRSYQNAVVVIAALFAYSAVLQNVDHELAFSISDYYINASESQQNINELKSMCKDITAVYMELICKYRSIPYSPTIKQAVELIYNNIYSALSVNEIACKLGSSASYLSKAFKSETGMSIIEFVHREKLREARKLMIFTDMDFTEMAKCLGYSDLSYFAKICKKYTGKPLKELR